MTKVTASLVAVAFGLQGGSLLRRDPAADAIAYARLIEQYRHGDSDGAIRALIAAPELAPRVIPEVRKAGVNPSGANVPIRAVLAALPAAVMLHMEAGLYLNWWGDSAGAGVQWFQARILAELDPVGRDEVAFLRAWHHAAGLFFLGSYAVGDAVVLLERGRQRFSDDVAIAFALGQAYEARGTFSEGQVLSVRPDLSKEAMNDLLGAAAIHRGLLARDASLTEARLRLGRVLDLSGRSDLALVELRQVAAITSDGRLRYLAHLFAGDLLRRESRVPEARQEFNRAVKAWPDGQAAALGLAETLHFLGERAEAASRLASAIEDRREAASPDPFRSYHFGDRAEHKRLLAAVKAMARK
jgi:tetratricopeptide (TPR) repeat protein